MNNWFKILLTIGLLICGGLMMFMSIKQNNDIKTIANITNITVPFINKENTSTIQTGSSGTSSTTTNSEGFVDCTNTDSDINSNDDFFKCFLEQFKVCGASIQKAVGSRGESIVFKIYGLEQNKCHYRVDIDGHGGDCLFELKDMADGKLFYQLLGFDQGLQFVVDTYCVSF